MALKIVKAIGKFELSGIYTNRMSAVTIQKIKTITGHKDCIYTLEAAPSASQFFSGSGDGMVVWWDLLQPDTGNVIAKLPNSVYALHAHRDLQLLIAGHNYEGIHLIDLQNKKEIGSLQMTKAAIFDIKSHGGSAYVATGEGAVVKVDILNRVIQRSVKLSERSARCLAVSESHGLIAAGFSDNFIRILDMELRVIKEFPAHTSSVFTVRFSPDQGYLLSGSRDARLKVWDVNNDFTLSQEIVAHMYAINHLDFSPDGKHFVTCSLDKTVKVWDATEWKLLKVIDRARHGGHLTSVNKVLWTDHDRQLISASDDRTISVWHIIF
jgi:WD40 repeat protein